MSKIEKLLSKFKNAPQSLSYREVKKILQYLGFTHRQAKGSHEVFYKDQLFLTFAVHNGDTKPSYKTSALTSLQKNNLI